MAKLFAIALAAVTALVPLAASPALAYGINTNFIVTRVNNLTPKCRDRPDAPFVGRVSGFIGPSPARSVSFVGCFYSFAECERWRVPVSGVIEGRMILNRCEPRR